VEVGGSDPQTLTWIGSVNNKWNLVGDANWRSALGGQRFFNLDRVIIDDTSTNASEVELVGQLWPVSVVVNAARDYTFVGSGKLSPSTTLTKSGTGTLTLSGHNMHTGPTTVNGGTLRITQQMTNENVIMVAAPATFAVQSSAVLDGINGEGTTIVGDGSTSAYLTADHIRQSSLEIRRSGSVTIRPNGGPAGTSVFKSLLIAGSPNVSTATLDLNDNAAVVDYTGDSSAQSVRQQIRSGRGGSGFGKTWSGPGITSSAAKTANAAEPESRSVGYADNAQLPLGPYTSFRGQPVDDTSILITFTRTGDANLDGVVNDDDVTIVGANYAPGVPQPHWASGDFDYNGFVDDDDVTLLGAFYDPNSTAMPVVAAGHFESVAVPEPPTLLLIIASAFTILFALVSRSARSRWTLASARR
jgi:autotransporter-associated beta strand protein